jgi:uncharacterized protein YkwD
VNRPARRRLAIAMRAILIAALAIPFVVPSATASTETDGESALVSWINEARTARGLVPLRRDTSLFAIAGLRAGRMASANTLSHTVAGSLTDQLASYSVQWYRYGETIGYSTAGWSIDAARWIFRAWMGSSLHRALLMSDRFNYLGVGLAYRSAGGRTFASVVMTESLDHTRPVARVTAASRSGDDIHWSWSGYDARLQTHWAGLRDYDLLYRVGYGSWILLHNDTTATGITLLNRTHGQSYAIRVRATDRRGNVGAWSPESRISVP